MSIVDLMPKSIELSGSPYTFCCLLAPSSGQIIVAPLCRDGSKNNNIIANWITVICYPSIISKICCLGWQLDRISWRHQSCVPAINYGLLLIYLSGFLAEPCTDLMFLIPAVTCIVSPASVTLLHTYVFNSHAFHKEIKAYTQMLGWVS